MFLPLLLFTLGAVFGSDHCPGKLPSVLKDQTGVIRPDNSGNIFFITFLENSNVGESVYSIFVTTRESGSVGFTVVAEGVNFIHEGEASFGSVTTVHIPTSLTNLSLTLGNTRTVMVQAEEGKSIILYGLNEQNRTTDAFLGLPYLPSYQTKSSFTYLASSYLAIAAANIYSLLAIVPQETGADTEVNIHFRIQNLGTNATLYSTLNLNVSDGDVTNLTLSNSETVYIRSEGDLTGTVIHSDKPLSIFSGSTCTLVPFPKPQCDHLVEQIPPVSTWGTRFVTVPLKKREKYDVFRFIAAYNCTDVTVSCVNSTGHSTHSSTFTLGEGLFQELQISSFDYCIVRSTNRLLVVQYSVGTSVDGVLADPFMAVLPPVDQYSNNYTFATPGDEIQTYEHFINLVIPVSFFQPDLIILDGRMLSTEDNFVELKDGNVTTFYALQFAISGGAHTLIHTNPYAQFGLLVYGFGYRNSYGYPGAYSLGEFNIDLYNLNVVNASDKCISVLWDHPPDVTPGTLNYKVVLRDGDLIVNEITTKDTQVIVCDLCSRSVYTVSLSSSTNDPMVTTQAGDTAVRVRTNGLLGLTLNAITQTGANATCLFQHPLDTADVFCQISCTHTHSDVVEYRYRTPKLQNSLDRTHTLIEGLDPGREYTCTAIAVGVGCGYLERYNATVMFTTLKGLLGLTFSGMTQTSANATCLFQHPLDTADVFCQILCTHTHNDVVEYRYRTPKLQNSLDRTHTLIKGLDPGREYTCTAIAVGVVSGYLERYNATTMFTTLKGLLGLTFSGITQTGANATCLFQHPLDSADVFCQISCTLAHDDAVEYRYKTPKLQNSLDRMHTLIQGLDPGREYTCTAIAVGVVSGYSERYNATVMFTTLKGSLTEVVGAESQGSCSIGLGIPLAIALILLASSVIGNVILTWYIMIQKRKRSKVVHIKPKPDHKGSNDSSNYMMFRKSKVPL